MQQVNGTLKEEMPDLRKDPACRMILSSWENSIVFFKSGYPARTRLFDSEVVLDPCLARKGFRGHAFHFGLAGATYL